MFLNKTILVGNLTRDPELKALPSAVKICSFSVATNRSYVDKDGQKHENADFHNVIVFGRTAESCAQYLKKGQSVLVEGRLQTRSWDDKDGRKQYRTEIVADRVQFGFRPRTGGSEEPVIDADTGEKTAPKGKNKAKTPISQPNGMPDTIEYPTEEIDPLDIPF